jgi:hypothetical protein
MYEYESVRCEMRWHAMRRPISVSLLPEHDQAAQHHCTQSPCQEEAARLHEAAGLVSVSRERGGQRQNQNVCECAARQCFGPCPIGVAVKHPALHWTEDMPPCTNNSAAGPNQGLSYSNHTLLSMSRAARHDRPATDWRGIRCGSHSTNLR